MIINQLKLKTHDIYKKDEKLTTDSEPINNEDVIKNISRQRNVKRSWSLIIFEKRIQRI